MHRYELNPHIFFDYIGSSNAHGEMSWNKGSSGANGAKSGSSSGSGVDSISSMSMDRTNTNTNTNTNNHPHPHRHYKHHSHPHSHPHSNPHYEDSFELVETGVATATLEFIDIYKDTSDVFVSSSNGNGNSIGNNGNNNSIDDASIYSDGDDSSSDSDTHTHTDTHIGIPVDNELVMSYLIKEMQDNYVQRGYIYLTCGVLVNIVWIVLLHKSQQNIVYIK